MRKLAKKIANREEQAKSTFSKKGWQLDDYIEATVCVAFHNGTELDPVKKSLKQLTGMIRLGLPSREHESAISALGHITAIVTNYMKIRKPYPSDYVLSFTFLELKQMAVSCLYDNDIEMAHNVVITLSKIGVLTTDIPVSQIREIHETTNLCLSHLDSLVSLAMNKKAFDVSWMTVRCMKSIGVSCVQKNNNDIFFSFYLQQYCKEEEVIRNRYLSGEILESFCELICVAIEGRLVPSWIKIRLGYLGMFCLKIIRLAENGTAAVLLDRFIGSSRDRFQYGSIMMVSKALTAKNANDTEYSVAQQDRFFTEISQEVVKILRNISRESVNKKNGELVESTASAITQIAILFIREDVHTDPLILDQMVINAIDAVSSIHTRFFATGDDLVYDLKSRLPGFIAILGFEAISRAKESISRITIDRLLFLGLRTAPLDNFGDKTEEIISNIFILGIYALDKNNIATVKYCIEKIREYESSMQSLCPNHKPRKTIEELKLQFASAAEHTDPDQPTPASYLNKLSPSAWTKFNSMLQGTS